MCRFDMVKMIYTMIKQIARCSLFKHQRALTRLNTARQFVSNAAARHPGRGVQQPLRFKEWEWGASGSHVTIWVCRGSHNPAR